MAAYFHRERFRERTKGALLFGGFALFALGSAAVTAWGSAASDDYGVANANASRFTIFSSYLLFGILYLVAAYPQTGIRRTRLAWGAALLCFALLAGRTYARSVVVYENVYRFNKLLSMAYGTEQTEQDRFVFPNAAVVAELKTDLKRLQLGPYRASSPVTPIANLRELSRNSLEDTFHINGLRTDPQLGEILFAAPSSRFALRLASGTTAIEVDFGIFDTAIVASPPTDGVEFYISLVTAGGENRLWSKALHPATEPGDRGSQHLKLPLHSGTMDQLVFGTRPGATSENDWAYWANLSVTRQ